MIDTRELRAIGYSAEIAMGVTSRRLIQNAADELDRLYAAAGESKEPPNVDVPTIFSSPPSLDDKQ